MSYSVEVNADTYYITPEARTTRIEDSEGHFMFSLSPDFGIGAPLIKRIIEIYFLGVTVGKRRGRIELQHDLRKLLDAQVRQ